MEDQPSATDTKTYAISELYEMANNLNALKATLKRLDELREHFEDQESPQPYVCWKFLNRTLVVPRATFTNALREFEIMVDAEVTALEEEFKQLGIKPDVEPDSDD